MDWLPESAISICEELGPLISKSKYQQRVAQLAQEVMEAPPPDKLENTLSKCIDCVYGCGLESAKNHRTAVFADNPKENQPDVPILSTILCCWGVPGFERLYPRCRATECTDVEDGFVCPSTFWSRKVLINDVEVEYWSLGHQILFYFQKLADNDTRKGRLTNLLLQLHEACFNCIGRHKEVFEYCIYDIMEMESGPDLGLSIQNAKERAKYTLCRYADVFLDHHKRNALGAAIISPMKFLFQKKYSVYENLDNHGVSFWSTMMMTMFEGLEMPFESIVDEDVGWTWAAVDFLSMMTDGDALVALERFAAIENIGQDWHMLTADLSPPLHPGQPHLPGLRCRFSDISFRRAIRRARKLGSTLRNSLIPYGLRFAKLMTRRVLLHCFAMFSVSSVHWDGSLGPALAVLSEDALGICLECNDVRTQMCGDCSIAAMIKVNTADVALLLQAAGVAWCREVDVNRDGLLHHKRKAADVGM